jgi:hypothetical protein
MSLNQRNQRDHSQHFLEQFNRCYDGIVRRIQFRFAPTDSLSRAYLTLSVQQPITRRIKNGWVNVRLAIADVEEFGLRESAKESCRVLSSGLQIDVFNGLLFFDFAPYSLSPRGLEDYRRSGFYIAGRSFSWKVEEYSAQGHTKSKKA